MIAMAREETPAAATVDIVIPVHNEEADLERSVRRLHAYLRERFPISARITIVDNASTDRTWAIARELERAMLDVHAVHLPRKGRGRALTEAWLASDATVLAYMDVDLSTDLDALLPLVAPLLSGHSDISIGSRLAPGARVVRGPWRELVSRSYNLLLKLALGVHFRDAQCGFKAIRADVARNLLPLVEDRRWFFDTELLVLAEQAGFRIHELAVDWTDDPDSRVDIVATALEDLRGVARVSRQLLSGDALAGLGGRLLTVSAPPPGLLRQLLSFGLIGLLSTAAYTLLYWFLRPAVSAPVANALALLATALVNTAANRRLTFGVRGRPGLAGDHVGGLLALGLALVTTNLSIAALLAIDPTASRVAELTVLAIANAAATVARFVLLRRVILNRRRPVVPAAPVLRRLP